VQRIGLGGASKGQQFEMMTADAVECNYANTDGFGFKQPVVCFIRCGLKSTNGMCDVN
jgi:hypothetical protein